jgi:hypothetical protein
MYGEKHGGIGRQRKRQPLQEEDVSMIGHENLKQQRYGHKDHSHEVATDTADKFCDFPHGRDIRSNIQRVGDQQQQDHALEHDRRERGLDIGSESLAGNPSDLRAHGLDRGHQRIRQWHRSEHVEAELGSRLGIGRNAARIVVSRAGDKSGTELRQRMLFQAPPNHLKRFRSLRSLVAFLGRLHGASSCSRENRGRYLRRPA